MSSTRLVKRNSTTVPTNFVQRLVRSWNECISYEEDSKFFPKHLFVRYTRLQRPSLAEMYSRCPTNESFPLLSDELVSSILEKAPGPSNLVLKRVFLL